MSALAQRISSAYQAAEARRRDLDDRSAPDEAKAKARAKRLMDAIVPVDQLRDQAPRAQKLAGLGAALFFAFAGLAQMWGL